MRAVDLFAGAGGFSTGAQMAGVEVVWAANHWPVAVETHAANHPQAIHVCQDLHQADWSQVPKHDILLASPCCQGHSKARGKAANNPQHDASRSTAWAVVDALEYHRPEFGVVENVPEFLDWSLFPAWKIALELLGYSLAPHIIDAADHGVPQHRERMFIVLARSKSPMGLQLPKRDHVPASAVLDFECGNWSPINKPGRAAATLRRVANGRKAFGERFIAPYYKSGSGLTGRSVARPIGTITTKDRWAIVNGDRMRMVSKDEYRAFMGFPSTYALPARKDTAVHLLGNAVCPPAVRDVLTAIKEAA
ncbi:Modification methylase HhaI [Cupriavidus yeoncheonensis]|uniref:DNA (cytosine-5-)-methyltransferase n=1 Tax=Cupriavidus yeoncheonensis TaxID=1462994 RepID=A0A916ITD0_9BURK|nr:DNA cytosine methyltransferase [Cupriavidus yeoncheonensis]CAG2144522.1 Modification methylase HhaI [Cupriavidus yeoncheonensis]